MTTALHRVLRCLFLAGAFCFLCFAASAVSTNTQWSISSWKSDDGLPNDHVTGLAQTPDGYLWIATFSRPARFDGVRFDDYFLRDYSVPANQKITALQLGRDGLWMGTSHGEIISLNRDGVRIFTNTMPDKVTQALVEDGEGALWATFQGGQVRRIKDGKVASFGAEEGLSVTDIPGRSVHSPATSTGSSGSPRTDRRAFSAVAILKRSCNCRRSRAWPRRRAAASGSARAISSRNSRRAGSWKSAATSPRNRPTRIRL